MVRGCKKELAKENPQVTHYVQDGKKTITVGWKPKECPQGTWFTCGSWWDNQRQIMRLCTACAVKGGYIWLKRLVGCQKPLGNETWYTKVSSSKSTKFVAHDITGWRCGIDCHIYGEPWLCEDCAIKAGLTW